MGFVDSAATGGDSGDDVFTMFHCFYGVFYVVWGFGEDCNCVDIFVQDELFE